MDDGTDIDNEGNIMTAERVRNYFDVTGRNDYVKSVEAALDMGILTASSPDDCFYPMSVMTREDAAVILCRAFCLEALKEDYLSDFEDAAKISPGMQRCLKYADRAQFHAGDNRPDAGTVRWDNRYAGADHN